ncbi:TPA: acyltransferase [Candidatus Woesearchaeota archaeon]|nr:acyltransferase [Candidatus Woesearchaeota archaeon]
MKKEKRKKILKEFLESDKSVVIFDREEPLGAGEWKSVRSFWRIRYNFLMLKLSNLMLSMTFKCFFLRHTVGIDIGKNAGVGFSHIDPIFPELIKIGNNALIGWNSQILCHEFTQKKARLGKVVIGDNALIGCGTTIRSGVVIGENSVVAMHSLVNKDIPPNELWGGVPAKRIRKLKEII